MSRRRNINYSKLPTSETDSIDGIGAGAAPAASAARGSFIDEQFYKPPRKIPWKTIIFVIGFLIGGAICLTFGILITTGYFDKKYDDRSWPLLILGILMFIPGGYYGYILMCICMQRDGFTWDEIPML